MATIPTFSDTVNSIVKEVQKLTPLEQEQILVKIRLVNYLRGKKKPIAKYDLKKITPPTIEQIDNWKHDSRVKK